MCIFFVFFLYETCISAVLKVHTFILDIYIKHISVQHQQVSFHYTASQGLVEVIEYYRKQKESMLLSHLNYHVFLFHLYTLY